MGSILHDIGVYLLGGVTFIPLTLLAIFVHGWLTFSRVEEQSTLATGRRLLDSDDDGQNVQNGSEISDSKLRKGQDKEHAGYFAIYREWVPGGVSSKPPERTTPIGDVVGEESPSVYQSMYRSLFDRKHGPTMDITARGKANNIFYVVLRHGHLMLYDDSEQVEVRFVISLAQHDITVYGGDGEVPEGELWIKRNAIRLSRKASLADSLEVISKPFYLFSDNCSGKEDFYFALLQNQERDGKDEHPAPLAQHYETKHIIGLVQRLHSSEEQLQTRWLNALLGRLFLGLYKTPEIEELLRMKITKKIARANKPGFLSNLSLRKIDLGEAAPFITNPKLKDLNVDGECCAEADLRYQGKFRLEIGASARIDLGSRFKAREVNFVLAITVKKLEGHVFVRFKPPPSNRIWYSFEKMPHLDLQIEPIVSSRQITYNIILRAIEGRIREVFAETLVVPHWDDTPFFHTHDRFHRGGIWVNEKRDFQPPTETIIQNEAHDEGNENVETILEVPATHLDNDKVLSPAPSLEGQRQRVFSRKGNRSTSALPSQPEAASSTSFQKTAELPKAIRSKQFSAAAGPVTSTDTINREPVAKDAKHNKNKNAASVMSEISHRSQPSSPIANLTAPILDDAQSFTTNDDSIKAGSLVGQVSEDNDDSESRISSGNEQGGTPSQDPIVSNRSDTAAHSTRLQSLAKTFTPSEKKQQSLGAAALAAKNWGWKTINKTRPAEKLGTPDNPIGRGQPLPPPGQPLPLPDGKRALSFQLSGVRVAPPKLPTRPKEEQNGSLSTSEGSTPPRSAPPPDIEADSLEPTKPGKDYGDLLVVAAPTSSSSPPSPGPDDEDEYGEFMENVLPNDADSLLEGREAKIEGAKTIEGENSDGAHAASGSKGTPQKPTKDLHARPKIEIAEHLNENERSPELTVLDPVSIAEGPHEEEYRVRPPSTLEPGRGTKSASNKTTGEAEIPMA